MQLIQIISESLFRVGVSKELVNEKADTILHILKSEAKKMFFKGKISDLKDYIFNQSKDMDAHTMIHSSIIESLTPALESPEEFVHEFRRTISDKLGQKEMNLENLMELLDYGHLKEMLSMFKL